MSYHEKEWHRIRELQQSLADAIAARKELEAEIERLREWILGVEEDEHLPVRIRRAARAALAGKEKP